VERLFDVTPEPIDLTAGQPDRQRTRSPLPPP